MRTTVRLVLLVPLGILLAALGVLATADGVGHVLPPRAPAPAEDAETHPRLVVLGADGLDPRWLTRYLDEDEALAPEDRRFPHLARLRETGGLHEMESEVPPESPVAWASLLTGVNPGRHALRDFVQPSATYVPENGMVDVTPMRLLLRRVPVRPPLVKSRLAAPTFLERIHAAGYPVLALRQPLLFPAPDRPGSRWLAGLGTPDATGGAGFYTVWSARIGFVPRETTYGGTQVPIQADAHGLYASELPGPFDPTRGRDDDGVRARATVPVSFRVVGDAEEPGCAITVGGRSEVVADGGRSRFFPVAFALGTWPAIRVDTVVRFEVLSLDPLTVMSDPISVSTADPPFPIASPPEYGKELWSRYGPFETIGWSEQTFQLNDGFQTDEGFLRDIFEDMDRGAGLLLGELDRGGRCVFQVFTATDRALHCFYRYYDDKHPAYVPGRMEALDDPVGRVYERLDRIVGDVLDRLGPDDLFLLVSDHGFQTWRWGVNLNRWLLDEGYLVLQDGASRDARNLAQFSSGSGGAAEDVDWSKTRAYAMGLGQIYLNRRGRESQGIVTDEEAPALAREIRERLLQLRNPYRPAEEVVREVYLLHERYSGPYVASSSELQLGFGPGYRISWQTALMGDLGRDVIERNVMPWSGDHCSTDVSLVPAVLMSNRRLQADRAHVRDIAATALAFFGLPTDGIEGRPIPTVEAP